MARLPGGWGAASTPPARPVAAASETRVRRDGTGAETTLDAAIGLYRAGFVPLPVVPGRKQPSFTKDEPWQKWRWRDEDQVRRRMRGKNLGLRCDRLAVVDCDNPEAEIYWRLRMGEVWEATAAWESSGGRKVAFLLPDGVEVAPWSRKARGEQPLEFDICSGSGKQVVFPPSVHPDGSTYRWVDGREWDRLIELTPDQAELLTRHQLPGETREASESAGSMGGGSTLTELLQVPAEQRTNNWLTQLCGHLAKREKYEDTYIAQVQAIDTWSVKQGGEAARNQLKTIRSVWKAEQAKKLEAAVDDATRAAGVREKAKGPKGAGSDPEHGGRPDDNGGLLDGRHGTYLETDQGPWLWLDCHIENLLTIDADGRRFYRLRVTGPASPGPKELTVAAWRLNDTRERNKLLAGLGYETNPPPPKSGARAPRLVRYLESQEAERGDAVGYLGWHPGGGFLGDRGVLLPDTLTQRQLAPLPDVIVQAAHTFGTEDSPEEVLALLREIYTYQDETVAAVAMSWWIMSVLRGRYLTSVFPILCLEAVSGSGKTNGLFAFLAALAGNTRGAGLMTYPQVRNQLAAIQNGVIWIDDTTDLSVPLLDLLRQAPTKGTITKTGGDNTTSEEFHLVGSVLVSCEGLGEKLHDKAYEDRTLFLELPPVKGRKSRRPGREQKDQWLDILETLAAYGGEYRRVAERAAGTAVRMVHEHAGLLARLDEHYTEGHGRHQDKAAIIRMGAEILVALVGHETAGRAPELVARWLDQNHGDTGQRNAFFKHVLPRLLREREDVLNNGSSPEVIGVEVDGNGQIYVRQAKAADYWEKHIARSKNARENQLATAQAIGRELDANGVDKARNHRVNGEMVWCRKLTRTQSAQALQDSLR